MSSTPPYLDRAPTASISKPASTLSTAQVADPSPFRSILFDDQLAPRDFDEREQPPYFEDLNLDQVVEAVAAGRDEYRLEPYLYSPLDALSTVTFRQEVFQDVDRPEVFEVLTAFGRKMAAMREDLGKEAHSRDRYQKARWRLNAVHRYCATVSELTADLRRTEVSSRGLRGVHTYLTGYLRSESLTALVKESTQLLERLDAVRYSLLFSGARITVGRYDDESDYSADIVATFDRFRQGSTKDYQAKAPGSWDMNHVETGVLDLVAKVFPDLFAALDGFSNRHQAYADRTVEVFDREVQFYLAICSYLAPLRRAGLPLSYPQVSAQTKDEEVTDTFDLALAVQLTRHEEPVVTNDFRLVGQERILVVSGPNNGGKTTLARNFGQLHHLARLGCPVPGRDVHLFMCDQIFTHFEKEEDIATLAGKLQDELNRMRDDFERATPRSIVILNEMFSSTTLEDGLFLSHQILGRVSELDALCVCVTFLDELASLNPKTVSMVSTVVPDDPATRTYKLVRRPADGRAFARAIAEKYGLTYEQLEKRITR